MIPHDPTIVWKPLTNPDQNPELHLTNGLLPRNPRGRGSQSWWADRLEDALEATEQKQALDNGRRYMRKGQIVEMQLQPGRVVARVQGSADKPYETAIHLPTLDDEQWARVIERLLQQLDAVAELMAHIMPRTIEESFSAVDARLFPLNLNDWQISCTCSEENAPCTHAFAAMFLFIDRFDTEPFLLFLLRGRGRQELVSKLRQSWGMGMLDDEEEEDEESLVSNYDLATFFNMRGELPEYAGTPPPPEGIKVIRRLGFPPFFPAGDRTVQQTLENLYEE